jgi:hypothetical protein
MIPHIIWALVVLYAIDRAERLLTRLINFRDPTASDPEAVVIPNDLEAFALLESELHAQESVRDVIRDRYAELQNWNLVRRAIGVGTIDE